MTKKRPAPEEREALKAERDEARAEAERAKQKLASVRVRLDAIIADIAV